jgi:hypothetical protein
MAMIPRYPQEGSCENSTCSCPMACIWEKTSVLSET